MALANVETKLESLTSKKEKIIVLLDKQQKKMSKNQKEITVIECDICTIEANVLLSDDEAENLTLLNDAFKTSLQQILSCKHFP